MESVIEQMVARGAGLVPDLAARLAAYKEPRPGWRTALPLQMLFEARASFVVHQNDLRRAACLA